MHKLIIILAGLLVCAGSITAPAAINDSLTIESEGSCQIAPGSSIDLAKRLAFFIAKRKAVESAGKYLSRNNLIEIYEINKEEIYSLAARGIRSQIIAEKRETAGPVSIYHVRIRARVQASDFIKAMTEDTKQEKKAEKEPYLEEMEEPVSAKIDPGKDIARAYRLLRKKKWRMAMIYLDHLETKYPNWGDIHMAKALGYYVLHQPVFMKNALNRACQLGNHKACDDLKNLKRVHERDFGLSMEDVK